MISSWVDLSQAVISIYCLEVPPWFRLIITLQFNKDRKERVIFTPMSIFNIMYLYICIICVKALPNVNALWTAGHCFLIFFLTKNILYHIIKLYVSFKMWYMAWGYYFNFSSYDHFSHLTPAFPYLPHVKTASELTCLSPSHTAQRCDKQCSGRPAGYLNKPYW